MTALRFAHQTRTTTDNREETDATPCEGKWYIYDALIDYRGGPIFRTAIREAREICGTCPIQLKCLRDNREETWARAIITGRSIHSPIPVEKESPCGTSAGYRQHRRRDEKACKPCSEAERLRSAKRRQERAA